MFHSPDSFRQAAILLANLDVTSAEQLLDRFAPDEAETIRQAAVQLGHVSPTERDQAIRAFTQAAPTTHPRSGTANDGGVEIDRSLAARIASLIDMEEPTAHCAFDFLEDADADTLVGLLQNEHPQTIAVVLSSLPTQCAAELLVRLPKSFHINILHRLSELEPGDPESVEAVASELRAWVETWRQKKQKQARGLATVQGILATVGTENHDRLVDQIQLQDATLASRLGIPTRKQTIPSDPGPNPTRIQLPDAHLNHRPAKYPSRASNACTPHPSQASASRHTWAANFPHGPWATKPSGKLGPSSGSDGNPIPPPHPIPPSQNLNPSRGACSLNWDNLLDLDDRVWTCLLRAAEPELTTLALTGADPSLIDRITRQLPGREASQFRHGLEFPGPIRLSDVETARRELIQLANQIVGHPATQQSPNPPGSDFQSTWSDTIPRPLESMHPAPSIDPANPE